MRKNILKLGLLIVFICIQFSIQSQNNDDDFDFDKFNRELLIYANQFFLQNQSDDCDMYNRALIWIGRLFGGEKLKFYFNINKIQEKIEELSFQNNVFKREDLESSPTEIDSLSCLFDYVKYEFCNTEKVYLVDGSPRKLIIDSAEYIRLGIIFSQILYQKEQYALFRVFVRERHPDIHIYFLFEKNDDKWEIKEVKFVTYN